jgi:hypothetical protein
MITGKYSPSPTTTSQMSSSTLATIRVTFLQIISNLKMMANLLMLQGAEPRVRIIQIQSPNLFVQAAMLYGDLRGYKAIEQASGLSVPVVSGELVNLVAPVVMPSKVS